MNAFGRTEDFDALDPARQAVEVARTRRIVRDLLAERRTDFPAVPVRFDGREVEHRLVDRAYALARAERLWAPRDGDAMLAAVVRHLPAVLEQDRARERRVEAIEGHLPGDGHRFLDAGLAGLPRQPLVAPLMLESAEVPA
jgi:hypothetical protein